MHRDRQIYSSTRYCVGDIAGVGAGPVPARWPGRPNVRGGSSADERPVGCAGWYISLENPSTGQKRTIDAKVDTGAAVTIIPQTVVEGLGLPLTIS